MGISEIASGLDLLKAMAGAGPVEQGLVVFAVVVLAGTAVWPALPSVWRKKRVTFGMVLVAVGGLAIVTGSGLHFFAPNFLAKKKEGPEKVTTSGDDIQNGGQSAGRITNNGPVFNGPVYGVGGAGGSPVVTGNNNTVIGGRGGEGGVSGIGGAGGAGVHHGDNLIVVGGNGGGAGRADGRGGKGGQSAFSNEILPDGHRLSDFGRGGDGAHTQEYLRYHWLALSPEQMVDMRRNLRRFSADKVLIACNDGNCSELAASLVDFFERLGWPDAAQVQVLDGNPDGITIRPNNETTRAIADEIERVTRGELQVTMRPYVSEVEQGIIVAIGKKPSR